MSIIIPDEIVYTTHMTPAEFMQEIALLLFQRDKLTLGQASRMAGISQLQLQHLLASRRIPVHYDVSELESDLETLKGMRQA
jgi:predicted HTH domain antitoxin